MRGSRILLLALLLLLLPFLALAAPAAAARAAAADEAPQRVVLIGNDYGTVNGPTALSIFTTTKAWRVKQVFTYHWNLGKGSSTTGLIGIKGLGGSKSFGPWRTKGSPGQGGVPNAYWYADVDFVLPPGRYRFTDSRPSTWATNSEAGGRGMAWLMALPAQEAAPAVSASQPSGTHDPGDTVSLRYAVSDESGTATVHLALYDGGALDTTDIVERVPAKGESQTWQVELPRDGTGPLFFCAWAENAAGTKSAKAPRTACKWISMLVDIAKVSNGCGGEGWPSVVAAENYFGNTTTYDEPGGGSYTVSFVPACNLHDAGYAGVTVDDGINGGTVDYHAYTQKQVDDKFQRDMWAICRRRIPPSAKTAVKACIRDGRRYLIVRTLGHKFFDHDLTRPGTQAEGPRG